MALDTVLSLETKLTAYLELPAAAQRTSLTKSPHHCPEDFYVFSNSAAREIRRPLKEIFFLRCLF